jgi:membrane protease YdiL (CAAX protease family)
MSEVPPELPAPELPPEPPPPTCPRCLGVVRVDARYCPKCGRPLHEDVPPIRRSVPLAVVLNRVSQSDRPGKQTIWFYALWCLSGVVSSLIARGGGESVPIQMGMEIFDAAFTVGWVLILRREILKLYAQSSGGIAPYLVVAAAAYPIAFVIHAYVTFINRTFSLPGDGGTESFFDAGFGWAAVVVSMCVQPAVIEELAFRGVIQTTLREVIRPFETIIVAAIAFSIMHFNLVMFVPFVLLGLYLGWLRQWTGSLYPAMAAHFLHNALVTLHEARPIFPL